MYDNYYDNGNWIDILGSRRRDLCQLDDSGQKQALLFQEIQRLLTLYRKFVIIHTAHTFIHMEASEPVCTLHLTLSYSCFTVNFHKA